MIETHHLKNVAFFYPNNFKFCEAKKNYFVIVIIITITVSIIIIITNITIIIITTVIIIISISIILLLLLLLFYFIWYVDLFGQKGVFLVGFNSGLL